MLAASRVIPENDGDFLSQTLGLCSLSDELRQDLTALLETFVSDGFQKHAWHDEDGPREYVTDGYFQRAFILETPHTMEDGSATQYLTVTQYKEDDRAFDWCFRASHETKVLVLDREGRLYVQGEAPAEERDYLNDEEATNKYNELARLELKAH